MTLQKKCIAIDINNYINNLFYSPTYDIITTSPLPSSLSPTQLLPVYSSLLGVCPLSQRGSVLKSMTSSVAILIRCSLTFRGDMSGYFSNTWAAAPATIPQDKDVPVVVLHRGKQYYDTTFNTAYI